MLLRRGAHQRVLAVQPTSGGALSLPLLPRCRAGGAAAGGGSTSRRSSSGTGTGGGGGSSSNPYDGFFPGRKWQPVDAGQLGKGEARRAQQSERRRRWSRMQQSQQPQQTPASVEVVCHGNIARSQVFAHFLDANARASLLPLQVRSCGVASEDDYIEWPELVAETERRLRLVTPPGVAAPELTRDWWSTDVEQRLRQCTLVLAADTQVHQEVLGRLGPFSPPVCLFYQICGEGEKDFVDTYDHESREGGQNPERYDQCFVELERMAIKSVSRVEAALATHEDQAQVDVARALLSLATE
jgi:protein-tyrosine-phosphatase